MKRRFTLPIILAACAACFCMISMSGAKPDLTEPEYTLVWQDDFKGRKLDETHWTIIERGPSAWQKFMSPNKSLYRYRNGYVRLYARQNKGLEPADTASYLTGGICTQHKFTFQYGKIEVRARIHGATGCWPAIWVKNDNPKHWGYPERAEIDIMEYANHDERVQQTVHTNYTDILKHTQSPRNMVKPKTDVREWNTYGVEILPEGIRLTLNGEVQLEYPKIETQEAGQYPFGDDLFLLIDMQVGNKYLKNIVAEEYPAWMDVDWVKVSRLGN